MADAFVFKRSPYGQQYAGDEPKAEAPLAPGEWAPPLTPTSEYVISNRIKALVRCPLCKWDSAVGAKHRVLADGTLKPSLVCPNKACAFHVWARLDGWTGGEIAP